MPAAALWGPRACKLPTGSRGPSQSCSSSPARGGVTGHQPGASSGWRHLGPFPPCGGPSLNLRVCSQGWDARGTRQCPAWPWLPRAPLNRCQRAPFQDPLPGPTEAPTRQGWSWVPRLHRPSIDNVRMATRWAGLWLHGGWWGQSDDPVSVSILAKESRPLRIGGLWGGMSPSQGSKKSEKGQ